MQAQQINTSLLMQAAISAGDATGAVEALINANEQTIMPRADRTTTTVFSAAHQGKSAETDLSMGFTA